MQDPVAALLIGRTEWTFYGPESLEPAARGPLPLSESGIAEIVSRLLTAFGTDEARLKPDRRALNVAHLTALDPIDPRD